jgi:hypothetical protein
MRSVMYSRSYPAQPVRSFEATPELEAVARAVCREFNRDWRGGRPEDWAEVVDAEWPDFLLEARAALEALRELTGGRPTAQDLDRVLG